MAAPDLPSPASRRRPTDVLGLSALASLLLLAALVLGNVALARMSWRKDLTEEGLYTISEATKKVLRSLTDAAEIRVYWSEEIPASANPVRRRVEGLLDEYAARSEGRLAVAWMDMSEDGDGRREAEQVRDRRGQQMPEFSFRAEEGGRLQFSKGYMGLSIRYLDQLEFVGPLADTDPDRDSFTLRPSLEYEITSQLARMVRGKPPVIGFVKDAPGFSFAMHGGGGDRFSVFSELLEKAFGDSVRTWINLEDRVPDDVAVLIVAAPKEWPEKKVFHLEQFLLRGGKVLLLLDPVNFQVMRGAPPSKSGLEPWLASHGVEVSDGVLLDWKSSSRAIVQVSEDEAAFVPYQYYVVLREPYLADHPLVAPPEAAKLDRVPLYFPVEVRLDEAKQREAGRKATVLATTTEEGYLKPDAFGLNQILRTPPNPSSKGRHPVMVSLEGPFQSFWKGKPSPADPPPEPPPESPKDEEEAPKDATPAPGDGATTEPAAPKEGETPPSTPPAMGGDAPKDESAPPAPPEPPKEPAPKDGTEGAKGPQGEDGDPPPPPPPPAMGEEPAPAEPAPAPAPAPAEPPKEAKPDETKPPEEKKPDEAKPEDKKPEGPPKPPRLDGGSGVLVVVGDAELVSDEFSGIWGKDVTGGVTAAVTRAWGDRFLANSIDWMLGNEDLASLRGRGANPRLLDEVEPADVRGIKFLNYLAAPLLVILAGILVWAVRRYRT